MIKLTTRKTIGEVLPPFISSFALFVLLPLTVFALNSRDADLSVKSFWLGSLLFVVIFSAVGVLITRLPRVGKYFNEICRWIAILIVLLIIFPNKTGEIAGFEEVLEEQSELWFFLKIYLFGGVLAIFAKRFFQEYRWFFKLIATLAVIGALFMTIFLGVESFRYKANTDKEYFTQLGSEKNAVVIILDSLCGHYGNDMLQNNHDLKSAFDGFTVYPNAISPALSTYAGLTAMLTGSLDIAKEYDESEASLKKIIEDSFLQQTHESGVASGYVSLMKPKAATTVPTYNEQHFFDSQPKGFIDHVESFYGFWVNSCYRIVPPSLVYFLPEFFSTKITDSYNGENWSFKAKGLSYLNRRPYASHLAFQHLLENLCIGEEKNKILFFHSLITHPPCTFSAQGETVAPSPEGTAKYGLACAAKLVKRLEDYGVLDKTLVIIASDHGGLGSMEAGNFRKFNSFMMVRPPGASGELKEESMTVWVGDVYTTIQDYFSLKNPASDEYDTRSLLQESNAHREINVSLYEMHANCSYHGALKHWERIDCEGVYSNYVQRVNLPFYQAMQKSAQIEVYCGINHRLIEYLRDGWISEFDGNLFHSTIVVSGTPVKSIIDNGIVAIFDNGSEITSHAALLPEKQEQLFEQATTNKNAIIAGNLVNAAWLRSNVADIIEAPDSLTKNVNFVLAIGPAINGSPILNISTNDIHQTIMWDPSPKP